MSLRDNYVVCMILLIQLRTDGEIEGVAGEAASQQPAKPPDDEPDPTFERKRSVRYNSTAS